MNGLPSRSQFNDWGLPSKYTFIGFVISVLGVPALLIGYFNLFGKDQMAASLLAAMQASMKAEVRLVAARRMDLAVDGACLAVRLENLSSFPANSVKVGLITAGQAVRYWQFKQELLNLPNRAIPARETTDWVVIPMSEVVIALRSDHQFSNIVDIVTAKSENMHLAGGYAPIVLDVSYVTPGLETVHNTYTMFAVLR